MYKVIFGSLFVIVMIIGLVGVFDIASAAPTCTGKMKMLMIDGKSAGVCVPADDAGLSTKSFQDVLDAFVGWIAFVFGSIAVIIFIVCGMKYLFSMGDSTAAEEAKKCMIWSIVGVAVAGGAFLIIKTIALVLVGI